MADSDASGVRPPASHTCPLWGIARKHRKVVVVGVVVSSLLGRTGNLPACHPMCMPGSVPPALPLPQPATSREYTKLPACAQVLPAMPANSDITRVYCVYFLLYATCPVGMCVPVLVLAGGLFLCCPHWACATLPMPVRSTCLCNYNLLTHLPSLLIWKEGD